VIALILSVVGFLIIVDAIGDTADELDEITEDFEREQDCINAIELDDPDYAAKVDACQQ